MLLIIYITKFNITFFCLGYICQEIDAEVLTEQSNQILTAIIHGMRSTEPSNHVRLAATQALLNSLEFTKANFEKDNERNFIMEVVCEATQSHDMRISVAALQCLVSFILIIRKRKVYLTSPLKIKGPFTYRHCKWQICVVVDKIIFMVTN